MPGPSGSGKREKERKREREGGEREDECFFFFGVVVPSRRCCRRHRSSPKGKKSTHLKKITINNTFRHGNRCHRATREQVRAHNDGDAPGPARARQVVDERRGRRAERRMRRLLVDVGVFDVGGRCDSSGIGIGTSDSDDLGDLRLVLGERGYDGSGGRMDRRCLEDVGRDERLRGRRERGLLRRGSRRRAPVESTTAPSGGRNGVAAAARRQRRRRRPVLLRRDDDDGFRHREGLHVVDVFSLVTMEKGGERACRDKAEKKGKK